VLKEFQSQDELGSAGENMERDGVSNVLNGDGDVHHILHGDYGIVGKIAMFDARRPAVPQLVSIQGAQEALWDDVDAGPGVDHGF
jgi:hypothetical protein